MDVRWLAAVLAAAPLALAASRQDEERMTASFHGATPMAEQLAALDELGVPPHGRTAPRGVDATIWESSFPDEGAADPERVALGRKLYFDTRLSMDGKVACATCHDVERGFTDQRMVSEGIGGQLGRRNAPTVMNAALIEPQFWDGRATGVDHQATLPVLNPVEMGEQTEEDVVARLRELPEYREAFREVFGRELNYVDVGRAIGAFERTLIFLDAPFDRFLAGDEDAISEEAKAGWELFNGKARCVACHPINTSNPLGTDFRFHNIGVSARHQDFERLAREALAALAIDDSEEALDVLALATDMSELGRFMVSRDYADIGAFRTPQLRNVGITAPYMHDGSMHTLWDVMDHYNKGGETNAFLDGGMEALALTEDEIDQLVALMFTLTDVRFDEQNRAAMEAQRERAREHRPFRDVALANREELAFEERVLGPPGEVEDETEGTQDDGGESR